MYWKPVQVYSGLWLSYAHIFLSSFLFETIINFTIANYVHINSSDQHDTNQ